MRSSNYQVAKLKNGGWQFIVTRPGDASMAVMPFDSQAAALAGAARHLAGRSPQIDLVPTPEPRPTTMQECVSVMRGHLSAARRAFHLA